MSNILALTFWFTGVVSCHCQVVCGPGTQIREPLAAFAVPACAPSDPDPGRFAELAATCVITAAASSAATATSNQLLRTGRALTRAVSPPR